MRNNNKPTMNLEDTDNSHISDHSHYLEISYDDLKHFDNGDYDDLFTPMDNTQILASLHKPTTLHTIPDSNQKKEIHEITHTYQFSENDIDAFDNFWELDDLPLHKHEPIDDNNFDKNIPITSEQQNLNHDIKHVENKIQPEVKNNINHFHTVILIKKHCSFFGIPQPDPYILFKIKYPMFLSFRTLYDTYDFQGPQSITAEQVHNIILARQHMDDDFDRL